MRSAQSARKSINFCLSCGAVSCLLINFKRSHEALHSLAWKKRIILSCGCDDGINFRSYVSKYLMLCASSLKSAFDARVMEPISEYKSVVFGDDSITM